MERVKPKGSHTKIYIISGIIVLGCYMLGSMSIDQASMQASLTKEEKPSSAAQRNFEDPLNRMESSFQGNPSKEAIEAKMNKLLPTFGMAVSQENYLKVAAVLTALSKESKHRIPEMDLIDCIMESMERGIYRDFMQASQACVLVLDEQP